MPGDLLLHPVALVALALVIANDQVLKVRYPSELSGKLSDVAGPIFFPLFLVAAIEGARRLRRRQGWELTSRSVLVAVVIVGVAFVSIKTWHPAGEVYRSVMGAAQYPGDLLTDLVRGRGVPALSRVALVEDRTDLYCVPVLLIPILIARRVMDRPTTRRRAT